MSRALYCLRHRNTPEVFPVTGVREEISSGWTHAESTHRVGVRHSNFEDDSSALFDARPGGLHFGEGYALYVDT